MNDVTANFALTLCGTCPVEAIRATEQERLATAGVWIVGTPNGRTTALFASEELARQWITDNPAACRSATLEHWHVHTPEAPGA
jgi:hypothetical protein